MSVMSGSLDYLYYNGVLDHIPYEAYETTMATPSGMMGLNNMVNMGGFNNSMMNPQLSQMSQGSLSMMNGEQYLNAAMQGTGYNTYNAPDTFVRRNNNVTEGQNYNFKEKALGMGNGIGRDVDYEERTFGADGKSFRESITSAAKDGANSISNAPSFVKGLLAGGIMLGTLFCLLKGGNKSAAKKAAEEAAEETVKSGFWTKLNPKNWFKKNV